MKRFVCGLAAALAVSGVAVANDPNTPFPECGLVGFDDFDSAGVYLSRTITPDLSGSSIPGSFPSSRNDVFGIVDRNVNFDFADDSVSIFTSDTFGFMSEAELDNHVFGVEDLVNGDNPAGTGTAEWTFDVTGVTDLKVQMRVAAMGDFEAASDLIEFTWSIDGSTPAPLFVFDVLEDATYTYTMENGSNTNVIDDPLALGDPNAGGMIIDNCLRPIEAAIGGTGSVLTITFNAETNGGSEVFGFDDLRVCGSAPNFPPVADAGADVEVTDADITLDEDVMLDGTASTDDGTITDYDWYIGGGLVATGPTPTLTFGLGTTTVTLTVTDDGGLQSSDTVDITVLPGGDAPFADAGVPQEATSSSKTAPVSVSLDGSGSSDSDGTIVSYTWSEDGVVIAMGVNPSVSLDPGLHTIFLDIEDNAGNTARDVTFVKVLPAGVFARHDFDANLDASVSVDPIPGTFTSAGDAFGVVQRNVSASIPFAALDDSGSAAPAEPNVPGECSPFPGDTEGVVLCAKQDAFFTAVDLFNVDNANCDAGTATFTFNISGRSAINVMIDMGASGNFEANPDPNDPNGPTCDPNSFGALDVYDWTWSIDGSAPQPLFTSSVDEAGSVDQMFFNGNVITIDDPLVMNGQTLTNNVKTLSAAIAGTGNTLTVRLNARGDGGAEAYVFDDLVLCEDLGPSCGAGCEVAGGCADVDGDGDVDLADLATVLANFGAVTSTGDTNGDGNVNLADLANVLALFGTACP